jgi:hypothetical protein
VAFSPGLVGKDGREVLQGAALGVERVHLSVTDPVDIALKLCFRKGSNGECFFRVDQMIEGLRPTGRNPSIIEWSSVIRRASCNQAVLFRCLPTGDGEKPPSKQVKKGLSKIRWPNAPPRTCSWSKISDLEESCPPVLLKATSELQPCCLDQNEVKRLLQVVMNCCSVSPTMKRI